MGRLVGLAMGLGYSLAAAGPALAQTGTSPAGSADQAKAMLARAVDAIRNDKEKALTAFTRGVDGFHQGDLYVFCFGGDGKVDAHPNAALIGVDAAALSDKNGKHFAEEMLHVARPGTFSEVTYAWPRLLTNEPMPKTSYVTRVDDQVCGVGYYK